MVVSGHAGQPCALKPSSGRQQPACRTAASWRPAPVALQGRLSGPTPGPTRQAVRHLLTLYTPGLTEIESRMIAWRRDIHQNPELGNQERRTSGLVGQHLRRLGYEVRVGV